MNIPTWAGFIADLPDDQIEDAADIQVYGGRNVAAALGDILANLGCVHVSAPKSAGEMGWEFNFHFGGNHRFWCRIQSFHPVFWMLVQGPSGSKKAAATHVELWRKFGRALEQDRRFHKILWRSFKDGPPDWDEVEAASDPPTQTFDEIFALAEFRDEPPKPGCLAWFIGAPVLFFGIIGTIQWGFFETGPAKAYMTTNAETWVVIGCLIFFGSRILWWIRHLRS